MVKRESYGTLSVFQPIIIKRSSLLLLNDEAVLG